MILVCRSKWHIEVLGKARKEKYLWSSLSCGNFPVERTGPFGFLRKRPFFPYKWKALPRLPFARFNARCSIFAFVGNYPLLVLRWFIFFLSLLHFIALSLSRLLSFFFLILRETIAFGYVSEKHERANWYFAVAVTKIKARVHCEAFPLRASRKFRQMSLKSFFFFLWCGWYSSSYFTIWGEVSQAFAKVMVNHLFETGKRQSWKMPGNRDDVAILTVFTSYVWKRSSKIW